jgi:hypothetical protein
MPVSSEIRKELQEYVGELSYSAAGLGSGVRGWKLALHIVHLYPNEYEWTHAMICCKPIHCGYPHEKSFDT